MGVFRWDGKKHYLKTRCRVLKAGLEQIMGSANNPRFGARRPGDTPDEHRHPSHARPRRGTPRLLRAHPPAAPHAAVGIAACPGAARAADALRAGALAL